MNRFFIYGAASLMACAAQSVTAAEVWKCRVGDKVHYSDQPCAATGQPLAPRALQGNTIDTSGDRRAANAASQPPSQDGAPDSRQAAAQRPSNVCPSERDIAGMETSASARSLDPKAKDFIRDEIRRARQCQKGQGQYSAADWAISKDALNAQSSLSGAADARSRAEAMHSAADAAEGDRIARQRENERREAERRERLGTAPR